MPIHLRAEPSDYAPAVLVPGDPRRATYIAETFFDPGARCVNEERGMLGLHRHVQGQADQRAERRHGLRQRGDLLHRADPARARQRIIRVGTAGGLADGLRMGDTVVAISATRRRPDRRPSSPTARRTRRRRRGRWSSTASRWLARAGATVHVGPDRVQRAVLRPARGMMQRWKDRGHLAVEMEAAVLYTLGAIHEIETLCAR